MALYTQLYIYPFASSPLWVKAAIQSLRGTPPKEVPQPTTTPSPFIKRSLRAEVFFTLPGIGEGGSAYFMRQLSLENEKTEGGV